MSQIFKLVYTSKACVSIEDALLSSIIRSSLTNNERLHITGFLVARDGYFLQLLEGPEKNVRECLGRISKDSRHNNIIIHGEAYANKRFMEKWSMALVDVEDIHSSSKDIIQLIELGRSGQKYKDEKSLMNILNYFSKKAKIVTSPFES